jgi:hypothetical protein
MNLIPLDKPVLEIGDPDSPKSLKELQDKLIQLGIYCVAEERAKELGVSLDEFVSKLDKGGKEVLVQKGTIAALQISASLVDLSERTQMSIAYKIMRKNIHRTQGESDSFEDFLLDKIDHGKRSSVSEAVFLLQLIETLEQNGENVNALFSNSVTYGKLVETIPTLRKKNLHHALISNHRDEVMKEFAIREHKTKEALISENDEEAKKELQSQLVELRKQRDEVSTKIEKELNHAYIDLRVTTKSALQLSQSPIDRASVSSALPVLTKANLEKEKYVPSEISHEYSETKDGSTDKKKPIALMANTDKEVVFAFAVKAQFGEMITRMLSAVFDVHIAEVRECRDLVESYIKKEKKNVK